MKKFLYCIIILLIIVSFYWLYTETSKKLTNQELYNIAEQILNKQAQAILSEDYITFKNLYKNSIERKDFDNLSAKTKDLEYEILYAHQYGKKIIVDIKRRFQTELTGYTVDYKTIVLEHTPDGWKIDEHGNHVLIKNPNIVTGSGIEYQDILKSLIDQTNGNLFYDYNFMATYGDVVLVGLPYDNAMVADLQKKGLVKTNVTETWPGSGIGVIQSIKGVKNYRNLILIQASDKKGLKNAIKYFINFIKNNIDFNDNEVIFVTDRLGVLYRIEDEKAKEPELNIERIDKTIKNATKNMILIINHVKGLNNWYNRQNKDLKKIIHDDDINLNYLKSAFKLHSYQGLPLDIGIILTPANMTLPETSKIAIEIYQGKNLNTVENYLDFVRRNLIHTENLFGRNIWIVDRKSPANEMLNFKRDFGKISGDCYALSSFSTAILRLMKFNNREVFNVNVDRHVVNFLSFEDRDYIFDPSFGFKTYLLKNYTAHDVKGISNDTLYFILYKHASNLTMEEGLYYIKKLYELIDCRKRDLEVFRKGTFTQDPFVVDRPITANIEDVFKEIHPSIYTDVLVQSELPDYEEVMEELRIEVSKLLSNKAMNEALTLAMEYPGSQYNFIRYALGDVSVNRPQAYAMASVEASLTKEKSSELAEKSLDKDIIKITKILEEIQNIDQPGNNLTFPDYLLISKKGSPWSKALLAYGLLKNKYKDIQCYIILADNNGYLAIKHSKWEYIDCSKNLVVNEINPRNIITIFNEDKVFLDMQNMLLQWETTNLLN
jgi:hypothetical protein